MKSEGKDKMTQWESSLGHFDTHGNLFGNIDNQTCLQAEIIDLALNRGAR